MYRDPSNDCQIPEVWMQHEAVYLIENEPKRSQCGQMCSAHAQWELVLNAFIKSKRQCWIMNLVLCDCWLTSHVTLWCYNVCLVFKSSLFILLLACWTRRSSCSQHVLDFMKNMGTDFFFFFLPNLEQTFSSAPYFSIEHILAHPSLSVKMLWRILPNHPHNKSILVKPLIHTSQI